MGSTHPQRRATPSSPAGADTRAVLTLTNRHRATVTATDSVDGPRFRWDGTLLSARPCSRNVLDHSRCRRCPESGDDRGDTCRHASALWELHEAGERLDEIAEVDELDIDAVTAAVADEEQLRSVAV